MPKIIHPSDSNPQQIAEHEIIQKVSLLYKVQLEKRKLSIGTKQMIEIDGFNETNKVLCEAFAHIGELKPAQKNKVMADILKMLLIEKIYGGDWKKIIAFADNKTAHLFQCATLYGKVVKTFGIDIQIVKLEPETCNKVQLAQKRQRMINADELS